ncbi:MULTISPECIES: PAC2 family protein [Cellulosimicrobium]|jgi:predicted ATP-grasp superfamily ATP-dependent carboligase|uniref:PAC2 family protein n=1 Tax=Cellulosimicrobium sp. ES-005 TaxID=3163031 RepID=A0AAU8G7S6_9MICO|nr:PAC2 family protein [Cellulosimicrobium cellulans]MCO7272005.1 PAC2 family protein [Cellulosimicrobium cellulans]
MTENATEGTRQTVMIAAFEGWNDAGSAATAALQHLHEVWGAEDVDELDPEEYHDFQVNRPVVTTDDDGLREITWPTTTIASATLSPGGRRVVLVHGIEPSMRWRRYCRELLDIAEEHDVRTVVTLGALLADVPHTRPIPMTATSESVGLQAVLDVEPSTYEGPTGIVGVLQHAAAERGLQSVSLWAAVPHYVAHPPSPKATLAILARIEELLSEPIPLGDLPEDAEAWQHGVDELAAEDAEIAEYVQQLEEAKDTAELPEASGEAIAREFERYLRRRDRGNPGKGPTV